MEFTEEEEEDIEIHHSVSLPPNYVSLAQLREQWLQKQAEKQLAEKLKDNQKQEQELKLPEEEGKQNVASQRPRQDKGKNKIHEREPGRGRSEWKRAESSQKVYVCKGVVGVDSREIGGDERRLKPEELAIGAPADQEIAAVAGVEEKIYSGKKKKKWKKRRNRDNKNPVGAQENPGNLGDSSCLDDGEDKCNGELGRNATGSREVRGKVNVSKNGVVPEYKGEKFTLLDTDGKCGHGEGFKEQYFENSEEGRLVHTVFSISAVELLPKREAEVQVPVARNGVNQVMLQAETVCIEKAAGSPELNEQEDSSVNGRRKRGKGKFNSRYKSSVHNSGNLRDSSDSKVELGCEENVKDEGMFLKENGRKNVQKERTARGTQPCGNKNLAADNLTPTIRRDLRVLSLDESREGDEILKKGRYGRQNIRFEKSRDVKGLVWVKKGEISDTNLAAS